MSDPTVMLEVEAGNKTGIYYVTVSNLPFNTQWTELKDFVRTVSEVDYVEAFNASTHAWVRVLGYQDYCKAFQLLNGGLFRGRRLVADCRNANEKISIRMLVDTGQPLPRQAPSSSGPAGYVSGRGNAEGYYQPFGAVMGGLAPDYPYRYEGYWPGHGYGMTAEPQSQRGHGSKKKKKKKKKKNKDKRSEDGDKYKGKETENGLIVPITVDGSSWRGKKKEKDPVVPVIVDGSSTHDNSKVEKDRQ